MSSISIIGSGNMASAIGALALKGGNTVEIIGRDTAKAAALASALGTGATAGTWGATPAGDIVILAVLFDRAVPTVSQYGDALAGKIIVDITNPLTPGSPGWPSLTTPPSRNWSPKPPPQAPMSSRRSTHSFATSWPRVVRWMCSSPAVTRRPR